MKVVGNLKGLIGDAAVNYISLNADDFKSTTPGPAGSDGPIGPQGVSVHHLKGTSTTQDEGDFAYPGETDTYTFYPDANETYPLGWFNVRNGYDAYQYAVTAGYAGSEADFYLELANVREYYDGAVASAQLASDKANQTTADAAQVTADKVTVVNAKTVVLEAKDTTVSSANTVQGIFLGAKSIDPIVDNQGNALIIGVMYYNTQTNTLRIWNGAAWTLGAFSASGAVLSVNGRGGAVELTKSDVGLGNVANTADNVKSVLYAATAGTASASDVYAWAKTNVKPSYTATEIGLGNVTNESKTTMFTSPTFTGVPLSTTASVGTSTTQVATTAFVVNEINKIEEW